MTTPHHFEVHGPRRDYDYTPFCSECHTDAVECAQEWLAEVFDVLEPGEECLVEVRCVEGEIDDDEGGCHGETCKGKDAPAEHQAPQPEKTAQNIPVSIPTASSAPRRCAKCGLAENEHDVRHPFVAARGA